MNSTFFLASFLLVSSTICSALPAPLRPRTIVTSEQLEFIAPESTSCDGALFPIECRTSGQAVSVINSAFAQYSVTSPGEMAALLSWMAFETGGFKYQKNHWPGNPGHGTRNMQSAAFNTLYAQSIPALQPFVLSISLGTSASDLSAMQLNKIRGLLIGNDLYDFASAAWFLTTQCSARTRSALQSGGQAGFESFLSNCVGTTVTYGRLAYWQRAVSALIPG